MVFSFIRDAITAPKFEAFKQICRELSYKRNWVGGKIAVSKEKEKKERFILNTIVQLNARAPQAATAPTVTAAAVCATIDAILARLGAGGMVVVSSEWSSTTVVASTASASSLLSSWSPSSNAERLRFNDNTF
jgi:hypothetical protein